MPKKKTAKLLCIPEPSFHLDSGTDHLCYLCYSVPAHLPWLASWQASHGISISAIYCRTLHWHNQCYLAIQSIITVRRFIQLNSYYTHHFSFCVFPPTSSQSVSACVSIIKKLYNKNKMHNNFIPMQVIILLLWIWACPHLAQQFKVRQRN